jgi:hypothetical protein
MAVAYRGMDDAEVRTSAGTFSMSAIDLDPMGRELAPGSFLCDGIHGECICHGDCQLATGDRIGVVWDFAFAATVFKADTRGNGRVSVIAFGVRGDIFHLPKHLRERWEEIARWQEHVHSRDLVGMAAYADWCDERGWTERAAELRAMAVPPEPMPVVECEGEDVDDWPDGWEWDPAYSESDS